MTYEIYYGGQYHIKQAGNPWQACIEVLQDSDDGVYSSFDVRDVENGTELVIGLGEVVKILELAGGWENERKYCCR